MASPPFNIAETVPGDTDVAAVYPALDRTYRDVVESWIKWNHNVMGRHDEVELDFHVDGDYPGTANVTTIWASSTGTNAGKLKMREGTGPVQDVGVPTGVVLDYAANAIGNGYIACGGQAVNRVTEARLFGVISTLHGVGDGATTFNVPDLRGRTVAGEDDMGGSSANRLTGLAGGVDGDAFGAAGGLETHTLTTAQLAVTTPAGTVTGHTHFIANTDSATTQLTASNIFTRDRGAGNANDYAGAGTGTAPSIGLTSSATSIFSGTAFGSGAAHNNVQPTLVLTKMIKN